MSDEQIKPDEDEQIEDLEVNEDDSDKVVGGLNPQPLPPEPPREGRQ